uniref:Uncharacterized protein n=1 Tax=Schistocephalus solidus TaxID=70667 RepID=A0A0X3Q3G3_SCHSO
MNCLDTTLDYLRACKINRYMNSFDNSLTSHLILKLRNSSAVSPIRTKNRYFLNMISTRVQQNWKQDEPLLDVHTPDVNSVARACWNNSCRQSKRVQIVGLQILLEEPLFPNAQPDRYPYRTLTRYSDEELHYAQQVVE